LSSTVCYLSGLQATCRLHHLHAISLEPHKLLPAGKIVYDLGDCGGVHRYCAELVTKPERHVEGIGEVQAQDSD